MAVNINVPSQVKTYADLAAFPASGALKTIYIAEDTNKTYRWTGSVYVEVSASASGITIGTTAITSGTVGRVLFEGTGNVVQESANLFWDNTNRRLGIGTSSPARALDILSSGDVLTGLKTSSATGVSSHVVLNDINSSSEFGVWGSTRSTFGAIGSNNAYIYSSVDFAITSLTNIKFGTGASLAERMRIVSGNGNVLINTTTDAGYKLDVNGTARVSGSFTQSGSSFTSASTGFWQIQNTGISTSLGSYISNQGVSYYSVLPFCINVAGGAQSQSASLQIDSTTKGFLPPRMTTTQKNAIATPATGLMVYDTTLNVISYYNGTSWI